MDRRDFLKTCGLMGLLIEGKIAFSSSTPSISFKREVPLKREDGKPFNIKYVKRYEPYIFFYPYASTPCLLVDVGRKAEGGIGEGSSIVSFSLICSHQWAFPTPSETFITYYGPEETSLADRGNVIQCCVHMSVFDPLKGGGVLDGPADYPLARIILDTDGEGNLYAVGVEGKDQFQEFFQANRGVLKKLYGSLQRAKEIVKESRVVKLKDYTKEEIKC